MLSGYFIFPYLIASGICFLTDFGFLPKLTNRINESEHLIPIYKKVFPKVTINLIIVVLIIEICNFPSLENLESIPMIILKLLYFVLVLDLVFYLAHRLLHVKFFYNTHHYIHHKLRNPIGYGALYASWLDLIVTNILPVLIGTYLANTSIPLTKFILMLTGFNVVLVSHSGYNLNLDHYIHHKFNNVNFGLFFTDGLFNTYRNNLD